MCLLKTSSLSVLKSLTNLLKPNDDRVVYFISDLHLSERRTDLCAAFFDFISKIEEDATDLFILGDFFNFWVGDDIATDLTDEIACTFKALSDKGIAIHFQHGNRDFAVGEQYANACGMSIIPEIYALPFAPEIVVLHGDQLCLADTQYQRYRNIIRHPWMMKLLRALPRRCRLKIGNKLRETSQEYQQHVCCEEGPCRCDVDEAAIESILVQYGASIMIHGHTHKPAVHTQIHGTRWVLSDWDTRGDYLRLDQSGLTRHTFSIDPLHK